MRQRSLSLLLVVPMFAACGRHENPGPLPVVAGMQWSDPGFPTTGRVPTRLSKAVFEDDLVQVVELLQRGDNPNVRWGETGDRLPLEDAIDSESYGKPLSHRLDIVRALLKHGADPNVRYCLEYSRRQYRSEFRSTACSNGNGRTPLYSAAVRNQTGVVYELLNAGANPTLKDWNGRVALLASGGEAIFQLLLSATFPEGGDSEAIRALGSLIPKQQDWSPTLTYGELKLALGRPSPPTDLELSTQLAGALADRNPEFVRLLLEHGANPNRWFCPHEIPGEKLSFDGTACKAPYGITPLMAAAGLGKPELNELLLQFGADASKKDWLGRTAANYERIPVKFQAY